MERLAKIQQIMQRIEDQWVWVMVLDESGDEINPEHHRVICQHVASDAQHGSEKIPLGE